MPFYRFEIEARLTEQNALGRIKEVVGPPRAFFGGTRYSFGAAGDANPPFIGRVGENSFRVRRDIRYRNSFLPLVWGRITSAPTGSHVSVMMFLHPFTALFMLVWFTGVGVGVVDFFKAPLAAERWVFVVPMMLFIFGVMIVCAGFFPEAIKARRLLEHALARSSA